MTREITAYAGTALFAMALAGFALCGVLFALGSCSAATPSPQAQATVATYAAALQVCIEKAKAEDSGLAGYRACAADVDRSFGRTDGGAP